MTNRQRAKLDSYNRVTAFDTKYADDLATIDEYAAEQTNFDAAVAVISGALAAQLHLSGIKATDIDTLKSTMAQTVIMYAMRGAVKANNLATRFLPGNLRKCFPTLNTHLKQQP